jgi:5'-nucleotidase
VTRTAGFNRRLTALAALGALAVVGAACSDDGGSSSSSETDVPTTDAPAGDTLTILVSNDDGVEGEGIAVLAETLAEIPDSEVIVYAPADDRTGSGNDVSTGTVATSESQLINGFPAVAVDGTPADSINAALDAGVEPDVVASGINFGPNLGLRAENLSGTIGAARAAATADIPAIALSQGLGDPIDYQASADVAAEWITERQDDLIAGDVPVELISFNVPSCSAGEIVDVVEAPLAEVAAEGSAGPVDCTAGAAVFTDDSVAFINGYAVYTVLELE